MLNPKELEELKKTLEEEIISYPIMNKKLDKVIRILKKANKIVY